MKCDGLRKKDVSWRRGRVSRKVAISGVPTESHGVTGKRARTTCEWPVRWH